MKASRTKRFSSLIRDRLRAIQDQNRLGRQGQAVVRLDQQSVGRLSRMDALRDQAMARAQQARRDIQTRRLRAAQARIAQGEFGHCEDCGEEIAARRLELDPAAGKCIACASG